MSTFFSQLRKKKKNSWSESIPKPVQVEAETVTGKENWKKKKVMQVIVEIMDESQVKE